MKRTMVIVGLGLIGGSLALALKGFEDFEIVGVDVSQPTLRYAAEHGVGDRVTEQAADVVPQADVVIRNPTHFAVALRYRPDKDPAPVVLAKGVDEVAARIVRKAEECKIAIVENVPLARALYASTELNQEIPQELYNAVAEVLVYLYKMDKSLK